MISIQLVDVSTIKTLKFNPSDRITPECLEDLETSIQKNGIINPLQMGKDNTLGDGNRRLAVAKSLGITTVPVVKSEKLTGQQLYALNATHKPHKGKEWYEAVVKGYDVMLVPEGTRRLVIKMQDVLSTDEWEDLGNPDTGKYRDGTSPHIYSMARSICNYTGRASSYFTRLHILWMKDHKMINAARRALDTKLITPETLRQRIDDNAPLVSSDFVDKKK